MPQSRADLDFDDRAIAENYDHVLVPLMFDPWADLLLERTELRDDISVLDVACGSGIVTQKLAERTGAGARIVAADISPAMLAVARTRVDGARKIEFVASPAEPLAAPDAEFDLVICQQGFQFFPDRDAAAREMHRVLKPGGRVAIATWCELERCDVFGAMQRALAAAGCTEAAEKLAGPFNFMPQDELRRHFTDAGFVEVRTEQPERPFAIPGGTEGFVKFIFASPVASFLQGLTDAQQETLHRESERATAPLRQDDGETRGTLVANFLFARKPG